MERERERDSRFEMERERERESSRLTERERERERGDLDLDFDNSRDLLLLKKKNNKLDKNITENMVTFPNHFFLYDCRTLVRVVIQKPIFYIILISVTVSRVFLFYCGSCLN